MRLDEVTLPTWIPAPLRDLRRAIPAALALLVIVGAAIYLPSRSDNDGDATALSGTDGALIDDEELADIPTEKGKSIAARASGRTSGTVGAGGAAAPGFEGSGAGGEIVRKSYQGVTDKEIKLVIGLQPEPCGQDPEAIIQQALPEPDPEASIAAAMKWFSNPKKALANDLPASLLDKVGTGYYGRSVKHVIAEDHGDFCPEQSRNDAKSALSAHKPFMILGGSNEWDEEAVAQKTMKVTGRPATDTFFNERRPYLWGPITGATTINVFLAGYTSAFLDDKQSKDTGDVRTAKKPREFGIIFMDSPEINRAKDELVSELDKRGVGVKKGAIVGYEPKLSTIGVQARNIVTQLMAEQVTTVLMIMDPIAVQFITQAADNQNWRPEWITNTYGLMDWSLGPRTFMSREQALNTFGISAFWPSRQVREEQTEEYKVWKSINPDDDVPSDWVLWFRSFKLMFRGLAAAGPELTPQTFEAGYQAFCAPCARPGGDKFMPLTGYGAGDFTAVDDAHRQRYDPDAPDYAAAKTEWEDGKPPAGAYVYEDGGRRYPTFD